MTLDQLAIKYGTDKSSLEHGYMDYYQRHLPEIPRNLLEIGTEHGESFLMWKEWFKAWGTDIWVYDLFMNPDFKSEEWFKERGAKTIKGSQADLNVLNSVTEKFDIIIDDASHVPFYTLVSFKKLFFENLKSGGVIVIEDTHSNLPCNKYFWGTHTERFEDTFLHMILEYIATKKINNPYFTPEESERLEGMIDSCHLYQGKIVFIHKK